MAERHGEQFRVHLTANTRAVGPLKRVQGQSFRSNLCICISLLHQYIQDRGGRSFCCWATDARLMQPRITHVITYSLQPGAGTCSYENMFGPQWRCR